MLEGLIILTVASQTVSKGLMPTKGSKVVCGTFLALP